MSEEVENTEVVDTVDQAEATQEAVESTEAVEEVVEHPEWFKANKYKTIEDQAKAYTELEKRFGSFTGAPEEYTATLSDEMIEAGAELLDDDPLLEKAKEFAKEAGMDQDGFNKMLNLYAEQQLAEFVAAEQKVAQEMQALGSNASQRIEGINKWIDANMDAETAEGLRGLIQDAAGVKAVEQLIAKTRSAPVAPNDAAPAPSVTADEVRAMQFAKDENGNRRINTDPEFRAEFKRKQELLYGSGEHRQMVS